MSLHPENLIVTIDSLAGELYVFDEVEPGDKVREVAETTPCPICGTPPPRTARVFVYRDEAERRFFVCAGCGHAEEV